jgi:hypothetical protein
LCYFYPSRKRSNARKAKTIIVIDDEQGDTRQQVPGAEGRRERSGLSMIYKEELAAVILYILMLELPSLEAGISVYLTRSVGYLDRIDSAEKVLGS